MKKTYGVLIHGAGWVSTQHIAAFKNNPATKVVAISSRKLASARRRAAEAGLADTACYDDLGEALKNRDVDIVCICTPQHLHCPNALAAARAGKHLVIEKPLAISLDEMKQMRQAVRRTGVKTIVSFVLRWNPLVWMLKRLIADNALGKIYYVEADYCSQVGSWWSGWEEARRSKQGVSAMLVGGCHAADTLRWLAGPGPFGTANPVEVYAVRGGWRKGQAREYNPITHTWRNNAPPIEYDGLEVVLVKFDNGVTGKVSVNFDCINPYRFPIRVFGDRGTVFDNQIWSHKFPGQRKWVELPTVLPDSSDVAHHPFQAQIDHFVECIQKDVESYCNLEDAIRSHEVAFAALECYQTKKPVKLPLLR